ncbi:MAG: hypothetical protein ACOY3K_06175 [Candidatus Omnitrophota bacterium]
MKPQKDNRRRAVAGLVLFAAAVLAPGGQAAELTLKDLALKLDRMEQKLEKVQAQVDEVLKNQTAMQKQISDEHQQIRYWVRKR